LRQRIKFRARKEASKHSFKLNRGVQFRILATSSIADTVSRLENCISKRRGVTTMASVLPYFSDQIFGGTRSSHLKRFRVPRVGQPEHKPRLTCPARILLCVAPHTQCHLPSMIMKISPDGGPGFRAAVTTVLAICRNVTQRRRLNGPKSKYDRSKLLPPRNLRMVRPAPPDKSRGRQL